MRSHLLTLSFALAAASSSLASPAAACFCKNTAAAITSVEYEPDRPSATRIRLHGAFSFLLDQLDLASWTEPKAGYLYLECPAADEPACREEWAAIESFIQEHDCAAFGDWHAPPPRVRDEEEAPASPDPYGFIDFGGVTAPVGDVCDALVAAAPQPPVLCRPDVCGPPDPEEDEPAPPPRAAADEPAADAASEGCAVQRGHGGSGAIGAALLVACAAVLRVRRRRS